MCPQPSKFFDLEIKAGKKKIHHLPDINKDWSFINNLKYVYITTIEKKKKLNFEKRKTGLILPDLRH